MEKEAFLVLIEKYLQGTATGQEEQLLFRYYDAIQARDSQPNTPLTGDEEVIRRELFARISAQLPLPQAATKRLPVQPVVRRLYPGQWGYIAAAVFVGCSIAAYLTVNRFHDQPAVSTQKSGAKQMSPPPGPDRATLTLETGEEIKLEQLPNGFVAKQGTTLIDKTAAGQIAYRAGKVVNTTINQYNTLTTPKGAQYRLALPDGSMVWLNAASSIRFPVAFDPHQRRVELSGEAYFEIAPQRVAHPEVNGSQSPTKKVPFVVQSGNQRIDVLGTHFNVSAYADERSSQTTLLEGSVQVSRTNQRDKHLLKPGQQALVGPQASTPIQVIPADGKSIIAWKDGYFDFNDESLGSIMRKMARWYDVQVVIAPNLANQQFTATVSRRLPLTKALTMLQLTGAVQFKVDTLPGTTRVTRVTVTP